MEKSFAIQDGHLSGQDRLGDSELFGDVAYAEGAIFHKKRQRLSPDGVADSGKKRRVIYIHNFICIKL
jgi:hypothetical protein